MDTAVVYFPPALHLVSRKRFAFLGICMQTTLAYVAFALRGCSAADSVACFPGKQKNSPCYELFSQILAVVDLRLSIAPELCTDFASKIYAVRLFLSLRCFSSIFIVNCIFCFVVYFFFQICARTRTPNCSPLVANDARPRSKSHFTGQK